MSGGRAPGCGPRIKKFKDVERLAMRLQVEALRKFQEVGDPSFELADSKTWWLVAEAANEIIKACKAARGAPGTKEWGDRPYHPFLDPEELDGMGVPPKKEVTR